MLVVPWTSSNLLISMTRHQPEWRGALMVSAKLQRRRRIPKPPNYATEEEEEEEEIGSVVGRAVLTALESGSPRNIQPVQTQSRSNSGSNSRLNDDKKKLELETKTTTQLSGSDVLLALQRAATTQRSTSKRSRKSKESLKNRRSEDTMDYSAVRPLNIKRDWGVRLDEMETRLQELQKP